MVERTHLKPSEGDLGKPDKDYSDWHVQLFGGYGILHFRGAILITDIIG